ncbi:MAG: hypothetical protein H7Z13_08425 [Ferruginibacter sp.]|nr:hypothetical protein [Ferruginibacter sp.]
MQILLLSLLVFLLPGCSRQSRTVDINNASDFDQPCKVEINGFSGNIMEPFLSRDGNVLLFNNLNSTPENTNLHWATKINDTTFQYKGEIAGVNTMSLEAVPTLDNSGNLYFVSDRNYAATVSTLYQCSFSNGSATGVQLIDGVSKLKAGWVNFDIEVSASGQSLYFVDAQFDKNANPATADLVIAGKNGAGFQRSSKSSALLKNINTEDALEYAACISANELVLYFTRIQLPFTVTTSPEIFVSTRQHTDAAFGIPSKIKSIAGFAEAPTIAPDQRTLYYHQKEDDKFVLYLVRKK